MHNGDQDERKIAAPAVAQNGASMMKHSGLGSIVDSWFSPIEKKEDKISKKFFAKEVHKE